MATTPARLKFFLSHATADHEALTMVQRQLEALGVDVYLAEHDPQPGTSISAKVVGELRLSDVMVVLVTRAGGNSAYVHQEVGIARDAEKLIVPIVEKTVDRSRLGILTEVEHLPLDMDDPAGSLTKITEGLQPLVLRHQASASKCDGSQQWPQQWVVLLGLGVPAVALVLMLREGGSSAE